MKAHYIHQVTWHTILSAPMSEPEILSKCLNFNTVLIVCINNVVQYETYFKFHSVMHEMKFLYINIMPKETQHPYKNFNRKHTFTSTRMVALRPMFETFNDIALKLLQLLFYRKQISSNAKMF